MANDTIHSIERGEGASLVLLHGFPFDHALWREQLHGLEEAGVCVIAPDMPGFGRSPALPGDEASMDAYADSIADWAKSKGLETFALGGHSMGGYVAFAFARRHPEMLSGLLLICTRPGPDSALAKEGRYKLISEVRERGPQAVVDAMLPKLFAPATTENNAELVEEARQMMLRQTKAGVTAALAAMANRPDSTPGLAKIQVPTLIITGAEDAIIPAPEAEGLLSSIGGARHVAVNGAGHMAMLEKPKAFNQALKAFMQEL
jgi:3-oxoadipate enol-lactonase